MGMEKKATIGFWVCFSLVVGNMVGSGVFLLPSSLAGFGPISLWGWLITGIGSIFLALVFARLALQSSRQGGPFAYTSAGFGQFPGFLVAWGHWIAAWTGNAALAVAFTSYLTVFFPELKENSMLALSVTLATAWIIFFINLRGTKAVGFVQVITTALKLMPLLLFLFLGFFYFKPEHYEVANVSGETNFTAILASCALTLWAFLGLESATVPSDNVDEPEKTIPRATILGTAFVALLYFLVSASIFGVMSTEELQASNAPFADAAGMLWGDWGYYFVALGAIISCLGSLNGWMMIQTEVPQAAAEQGLFPKIFAKKDAKGRPLAGMIFSTLLMSGLIATNFSGNLVELFTFIILLASLASLIPYLFCSLSSLMICVIEKDIKKINIKTQLFITTFSFIYVMGAILGAGQEVVYWGMFLMFAGVPVYVWTRWHRL